jgi:predicted PurR-regulated permease PerM
LRLTARSVVLAVVLLGLTLATLRLISASGRVIGWVIAAAVIAGLLHPAVELLSRRMPRGAAVALVAVLALASAGFVAYRVVGDVAGQLRDLERAAPQAARDLEQDAPFEDTLRDLRFAERVDAFVQELPERLRGGSVQDALRSAATRGVAFLATGVLSLFFLIHGGQLLAAAARQLPVRGRERATRLAPAVYRRAWNYVAGSIGMSVLAGLLAYVVAMVVDAPGRMPLALWVALFDLIPLLGVIVGAAPLVLLTLARSPADAAVVALVLLAYQLVEALVLQRRLERHSLHVGPFVTVATGMVGLELYGIGGALVAPVLAAVLLAVLVELAPAEPLPSVDDGVLDGQG